MRQVSASQKTANLSFQLLNKIAVLVPRSLYGSVGLVLYLVPLSGGSGSGLGLTLLIFWRTRFMALQKYSVKGTRTMAKSRKQRGKPKLIANMGLFWQRDKVLWAGNRKVGKAAMSGVRPGAKHKGEVDFWEQTGIYALYADYHLIYVGQAGLGDKSYIGGRLRGHTKDNLAGRWDMFSWFGLRKVRENRKLGAKLQKAHSTWKELADVLEGILIEVAEPPQNSQKGRFGAGVHRYIQAPYEASDESLQLAIRRIGKDVATLKNRLSKAGK